MAEHEMNEIKETLRLAKIVDLEDPALEDPTPEGNTEQVAGTDNTPNVQQHTTSNEPNAGAGKLSSFEENIKRAFAKPTKSEVTMDVQGTADRSGKSELSPFEANTIGAFTENAKSKGSMDEKVKAEQDGKNKLSAFEANLKGAFTKKAKTKFSHGEQVKAGSSSNTNDEASSAGRKPLTEYLSRHGCNLCSSVATCITHSGSTPERLSDQDLDLNRRIGEQLLRGGERPVIGNQEGELRDAIDMSKIEAKMYTENGIFCCEGGPKYNERGSAAWMAIPELSGDKHSDIKGFMEAVNAGDVGYAIGELTPEEMKKITMVIKVNARESFEDIATILFAPTAEFAAGPDKKFTAFAKLDKPQRFENAGERSYLAYHCKVHRKDVRVGVHRIKWSSKQSWAKWENGALDDLMGHPKKEVNNFGQPSSPFFGL